jgi:deoxyuridine 5'-triphosphate nucleotidohydrolase
MEILNVKRLNENATIPTRKYKTDAGLDLYASEDIEIDASKVSNNFIGVNIGSAIIHTGIAVEIKEGYFGKIVGRSGLAFDKNILCSEGTIDIYRGELRVKLYNLSARPYQIRKGDRIAQLVISKCELPTPVEVTELSDSDRGEDGFGSSGR